MIRLTAIELKDFKNVANGRLVLSSVGADPDEWDADVVGIYGQNGSGKTSVITALYILKAIWCGLELPTICRECVASGKSAFSISVEAIMHSDDNLFPDCRFTYLVSVGRDETHPVVLSEKIAYKLIAVEKSSTKTAFEFVANAPLKPKTAWDALGALEKGLAMELALAERIASSDGNSLLMHSAFESALCKVQDSYSDKRQNGKAISKNAERAARDVLSPTLCLRGELRDFAERSLSIISPSMQAQSYLNLISIATHEGEGGESADARFCVNLNEPGFVADTDMRDFEATISTISTVIGALVPGLSLRIVSLGPELNSEGAKGERVEIVAIREGVEVPLRAESEGIKKLVAILVLLVDVYAKPNACVAIDELDSGVFEFLLGEILQVLQDNGRGQLIFTAHNLRPLETLSKASLVFTTVNPNNRYMVFKGAKAESNLRKQYLRAINLGGQSETIYEPTSRYEIDSAFYDAAFPEE